MDDVDLFKRLSSKLFAQAVELERPIRLVGFKLSSLEMPDSRQITLDKLNDFIQ